MKKLINDNYDSIVKRGLITPQTNAFDFVEKIKEETEELERELIILKNVPMARQENFDKINEELSDVILTCLNMAKHFNIDIETELKKKIEINFNR